MVVGQPDKQGVVEEAVEEAIKEAAQKDIQKAAQKTAQEKTVKEESGRFTGSRLNERPSKDEYYLGIAQSVSKRSTCLRKRFGAIIVKDDAIVSTGYTGSARGVVNCMEVGCLRDEVGAKEYTSYDENCISVHAEENAIINAARHGASVLGGILYIYGEFVGKKYGDYQGVGNLTEAKSCDRCKRAIINSGIKTVVIRKADGSIEKIDTATWVDEDSAKYIRKLQEARKSKWKQADVD